MRFEHPLLLFATLLPAIWFALLRSKSSRRYQLALKACSLSFIALALSEPELVAPQHRTAVVAMVDSSDSVSNADLAKASELIRIMQSNQGANTMRVVPFASKPRPLLLEETKHPFHLVRASQGEGGATNLETALASAAFNLPPDRIPRLVLISDGNENEGSIARAMVELRRLQIPVDVFPLGQANASNFSLSSVSLPGRTFAGEQIPIDLTVTSPVETDAQVELSAESHPLGSSSVHLNAGANSLRVHARMNFTGAAVLSGKVTAPKLGELPFRQSIDLRRARVLFLSQDPADADVNLLGAFQRAALEVSRDASQISSDLHKYQLIVLNNLDLNAFSPAAKQRLEGYVKDGGGLLLIGGERQLYKEDKQMDALDRALPGQLAPPKTPEGTCVALIVDKSSSMEGRKIELARISAIGVVDHLRPVDYIGVLIFDNSYQWAVPLRRAEDKTLIRRLISGITPDGGTQIAPALTEAYRRVLTSKATFKHIVLLTDGISEEGDSIDLAKQAVAHNITISTVGLGQDVNRTYLERVAAASGGKSYFLNDPTGLEQILLKDVKDYSGSTAVERPLTPIVMHPAEVLNAVDMQSAPALKGYARYKAKPSADTLLAIDPEKKDPLYVRWQYGLGRAAVFTSDAKSRWAESWMNWPGFDTFWINATRDLLSHDSDTLGSAHFNPASNEIEVSYRAATGREMDQAPPLFVLGPSGFQEQITLRAAAPGVFSGSIALGNTRGLFRIRPAVESEQFPEMGVYRGEEELLQRGTNKALLQQISAYTGGRYNPAPDSVFDSGGRSLYNVVHLWPACLALSIALTIAELVGRKWPALLARFSR